MLVMLAEGPQSPRRVNVLGCPYLTGRFSGVDDWPVLGVDRGVLLNSRAPSRGQGVLRSMHAEGRTAHRGSTRARRPAGIVAISPRPLRPVRCGRGQRLSAYRAAPNISVRNRRCGEFLRDDSAGRHRHSTFLRHRSHAIRSSDRQPDPGHEG
jgi:hypothetical protein